MAEKTWSRAFAPKKELVEFLKAMQALNLSQDTVRLFANRVSLPANVRLAVNLRSLLRKYALGDVENVVKDGLTEQELKALIEVDGSGLVVSHKEIAHGLFNIHERWLAMRVLNKPFRQAREARDNYEDIGLLADLLNIGIPYHD